MTRRLIAGMLGAVVVIAAVVVTLVMISSGNPGPTPGDAVVKLGSVRTCAQLRADSTATFWHVFNELRSEPCDDEDMADGYKGLSFKIDSTQQSGDTAYVMATRFCRGRPWDPHCSGAMFYVTVMKVNGIWKIDDIQKQALKQ